MLTHEFMPAGELTAQLDEDTARLCSEDPVLFQLLRDDVERQRDSLMFVASCSPVHPAVLACAASRTVNITVEGYPGHRYHAGCSILDEIEQLAIARAKALFSARFVNVQCHSASTANAVAFFSLLQPGDTVVGMDLAAGGHLSHGAKVSFSGRFFRSVGYEVSPDGWIDYDAVSRLVLEARPRLIVCGATAYPRAIDFARFRAIADEVGAWLLADVTHVAGLIAAGLYPSSIDEAHVTTSCTHKQLFGQRGALVMSGRDHEAPVPPKQTPLHAALQAGVFPLLQGSISMNLIAAKACTLALAMRSSFAATARRIVDDARAIAEGLQSLGYNVVSGGTDTHIVLVDLRSKGLSGAVAEKALEECGILLNRNKVPGDPKGASVAGGIRIGTNTVAAREMGPPEMRLCVELIDRVLKALDPNQTLPPFVPPAVQRSTRERVVELCRRCPVPYYGPTAHV